MILPEDRGMRSGGCRGNNTKAAMTDGAFYGDRLKTDI